MDFAFAQQAILASRTVTKKKTGEVTEGARLFISSQSYEPGQAHAFVMARLVRGHWSVENNIHWLRDAVCREDACRSRNQNAACALALLRTALLAPVRLSGRTKFTEALEEFAENKASAVALIRKQRLA